MRRISQIAVLVALLALSAAAAAPAATLVPVGGFDRPIFVSSDPEDGDRLLVVEREGRVVLVDGSGTGLFGDLGSLVSCCNGERGLLSIAPALDFGDTERFYAAYTGTTAAGGAEGDIHVDAFRPAPAGGGQLLREPIFSVGHADLATHNGGQLQFGPDGFLYLSTGDGGGAGDPFENGQDLDSLLGKVLRIDPRPGQTPSYAIPSGNPFAGSAGRDEIWSYGLRNPWRFSFDRQSGDLAVADVGQGAREEVDHAPSPAPGVGGGGGDNYGWNCREGLIAYSGAPAGCVGVGGFTDPVFDYPHSDPGGGQAHGCSITGGYVVRDPGLPDLYGRYLYADFCTGELRSLLLPSAAGGRASGDRSEGLAVSNPVSFGEDACGRIYVVSNGGTIYRLEGGTPPTCSSTASTSADPATAPISGLPKRLLRLRLTAIRSPAGRVRAILARAAPCAGRALGSVQLKRGGRPLATKRLGARCAARFRVGVARRSTFRGVLLADDSEPIRSPRLVLGPGTASAARS